MKIDLSKLEKFKNKSFDDDYSVLFEGDDFIIIHKKYGIAVQATDTEQNDLEKTLRKKWNCNIFVINRIDQPVSGLVIFGKTKEFTEAFTELLKNRSVHKVYLALVAGQPNNEPTRVVHFLKKLHNRAMTADEKIDDSYKESILTYTLIQSFDRYHLLKIDLETGRFHQIRAQLATIEMPIKGDLKYGSKRPNLDRSICLLSWKLSFQHPISKKMYSFESPLPENDILWSLVDLNLISK